MKLTHYVKTSEKAYFMEIANFDKQETISHKPFLQIEVIVLYLTLLFIAFPFIACEFDCTGSTKNIHQFQKKGCYGKYIGSFPEVDRY